MSSNVNIPSEVSFANGQSVPEYFKAFTNYMNSQCQIHAHRPFARYHTKNGFNTLTYAHVDRLATNLACKWAKDAKNTEVISFISDHTINYLIVMLVMQKLRITMMALSPRNSEVANVNLLGKTKSKLLVANVKYEDIAKASSAQIPSVKVIIVEPLDIETLVQEPLDPNHTTLLDYQFSDEDISKDALIIHSSGSTAFPKPIYLSNRYLFNMINCFHIKQFNVNEKEGLDNIDENDSFFSCAPL